jgi:hypothetical protein
MRCGHDKSDHRPAASAEARHGALRMVIDNYVLETVSGGRRPNILGPYEIPANTEGACLKAVHGFQ